ncbi:unnamed protein product [Citrullus colocynthis]|uniref:Uncharacterized protein n=1 Tax=Citrullus colocynthis TaxID=252529 RepID=A0ABP0Z5E3_9ROSI
MSHIHSCYTAEMVWLRFKCSPSLYLGFLIIFIIPICHRNLMAIAQEDLGWTCDNGEGNYTTNSSYKANLDHLLSTLTTHQIDYGFYNFSYGHDHKAYAIGLCRGDVMPDSCQTCLNNSIALLTKNCPTQIEAIVWYEDCMLRYSDRSLFGVMDLSPTRFVVLPGNASDPRFTQLATDLLHKLTPQAASGDSRLKYATGRTSVPNFPVIYGAVQCTPDLPSNDCTDCLLAAIAQNRDAYPEIARVRIMKPSCSIRFDINRVFQDPPASTPPPLSSNTTTTTSSPKGNRARRLVFIFVPITVVALAALLRVIIIILRARNSLKNRREDEIANVESLQFDFDTIRIATDGFSDANQLGRGGFGAVYKGRLPDGQNIAVKRLFQGSSQGDDEFKNEIVLMAKLQHRNLVQLLGFCFEQNEKLLIYECVENSSLEKFLFDPIKREGLDWKTRYNIIEGIVRGLIYLHEDSQLRIIHRDLKASNILLDEEMHAKISDFGTAKLFMHDQTRGDTRKIIVLEIVTGQKNNRAQTNKEIVETLVNYAWRNWQSGNALDIIDPCLKSGSRIETARCIHVGLLCVQENPLERPTMTTVLLMLNSGSVTLPRPSQPAFFIDSACCQMSRQFEDHSSTHDPNDLSITELCPR